MSRHRMFVGLSTGGTARRVYRQFGCEAIEQNPRGVYRQFGCEAIEQTPRGGMLLWCLLALAGSCGGKSDGGPRPARPAAAELLPEDQTLVVQDIEVRGIAFAPEALGSPVMPLAVDRSRSDLERQRKRAARKGARADDVQILVTLLWSAADRVASDAAAARALREEARTALRALRSRLGKAADAVTLQMLATAELALGDDPAALELFEELAARFPQHEGARAHRVWLVHLLVRQHRIADAAKRVTDWKADEGGELGAYVLAWVGFTAGDQERARRAIATAAATWKDPASRPAVERDLVLMLARGGADVAEAGRLVAEAAAGDAQRRYLWFFKLSEAYRFAGRYDAAARMLDVIIAEAASGPAGSLPPDDLVGFRYRQADYAFRQNQPAEAAARAIEAHRALATCGAKCAGAMADTVSERVLKLAQFSHTVFARSQDPRHRDAAVELYGYYLTIPDRRDAADARGHLRSLEETRSTADPRAGKHDGEVMLNLLVARREAIAACYEEVLLGEPALEGVVKLSIEVNADGTVGGANSAPGPGAEGLARVAACAIERARAWSFPSRTVPGKTMIEAPLQLRRQEAGPPAPPATAPGGEPG